MASLSSQYHDQAKHAPNWSMHTLNTRHPAMIFDGSNIDEVMGLKMNPYIYSSSPPANGLITHHHHLHSVQSYSTVTDDYNPLSSMSPSSPNHTLINPFANPCTLQPETPMLSSQEYYGLGPAKQLLENQYSPESAANVSLTQHYSSKTDSSSDNSSPTAVHPRASMNDFYDQYRASDHCIEDPVVPESPNSNYTSYWQGLLYSHLHNFTDVQGNGLLINMQDSGQDMLQGSLSTNNGYDDKSPAAALSYGRYCDEVASMGAAPPKSSAQFSAIYGHPAIMPAVNEAVMGNVDAMALMQLLQGEGKKCSSTLLSVQHEKMSARKADVRNTDLFTSRITKSAMEGEECPNNSIRTGVCAERGGGLIAQQCANLTAAGGVVGNVIGADINSIEPNQDRKRSSCGRSDDSIRANARKRARSSTASDDNNAYQRQYLQSILEGVDHEIFHPPPGVVHVRARRGQATDSHSLAERVRREKISQRMKLLQDLVPGCDKVLGKAMMLDEIINYVKSLQRQVEFLSMKLATAVGNNCCLDDDDDEQPHSIVTVCKPREAKLIKAGPSPFNSICS